MKFLLILISILSLAGCASPTLGPIASYESSSVKPKLDISGRFDTDMCSDRFAYLNVSVENKSSEWKKLSNLKIMFPYGQGNEYEIVRGEKLKSWAIAEEARQGRKNHNSQLARLAAVGLGAGLLRSSNANSNKAGVAVISGAVVSDQANRIAKNRNAVEVGSSQHILQGDLLIPPKMDRQYWVLLSANNDAPLMDHIKLAFQDEARNNHRAKINMANWASCKWQKARIKNLKNWALTNQRKKFMRKFVQNGEVHNKQAVKIEAFLQDHRKTKTVHKIN